MGGGRGSLAEDVSAGFGSIPRKLAAVTSKRRRLFASLSGSRPERLPRRRPSLGDGTSGESSPLLGEAVALAPGDF